MSALAEIDSRNNSMPDKNEKFATTTPAGNPIKVMSYNIFYDKYWGVPSSTDPNAWNYTSGTSRKDRVINMIMSESKAFGSDGPDILGVQETVQNQADDLQKAMVGYGLLGICGKTGCEACRIFYRLSRFAKINSGTFWLSETPDVPGSVYPGAAHPRIASWVILKDLENQKSFFVLCTHWDNASKEANYYFAQLIRNKINELAYSLPVMMMGDLNTREDEKPYLRLIGNEDPNGMRLIDTYRSVYAKVSNDEATFHNMKGETSGNRIDFIFNNDGFYTDKATIERNKVLNKYPSDHYAVTATIYYSKF